MVARLAAAHEEMTSDEAKGLVMDAAQAVLSRIVPVECKVVPFVLREIGDE